MFIFAQPFPFLPFFIQKITKIQSQIPAIKNLPASNFQKSPTPSSTLLPESQNSEQHTKTYLAWPNFKNPINIQDMNLQQSKSKFYVPSHKINYYQYLQEKCLASPLDLNYQHLQQIQKFETAKKFEAISDKLLPRNFNFGLALGGSHPINLKYTSSDLGRIYRDIHNPSKNSTLNLNLKNCSRASTNPALKTNLQVLDNHKNFILKEKTQQENLEGLFSEQKDSVNMVRDLTKVDNLEKVRLLENYITGVGPCLELWERPSLFSGDNLAGGFI